MRLSKYTRLSLLWVLFRDLRKIMTEPDSHESILLTPSSTCVAADVSSLTVRTICPMSGQELLSKVKERPFETSLHVH